MSELQLTLFGKPQVLVDGIPITEFQTAKAEALFYYLAVTRRAHSRESLAGLLWADMPEAKAKRNLTTALSALRKVAGEFLRIEPGSIAFDNNREVESDVTHFRQILENETPDDDLTVWQTAVDLYQGEFLTGFYVRNAPLFEDWMLVERDRLQEIAINACAGLADVLNSRAEYETALKYGKKLLTLDPWRESAHRQMMLLLARTGQRGAALEQYEICRRILAAELGVEPVPETTALYQRLKEPPEPIHHNLPPNQDAFLGRVEELSQLTTQLDGPNCRLLTLVGPGGIGKTQLAIEGSRCYVESTAEFLGGDFSDGIFFVNLAPIAVDSGLNEPDGRSPLIQNLIAAAIADGLDFPLQGSANLVKQLQSYLGPQKLLLVLDNFEHLIDAAPLLSGLLSNAPHLKLLVTSRERLNLQEEWVLEVKGLPYPDMEDFFPEGDETENINISELEAFGSVALFLQQAQKVQVGYKMTQAEAPSVSRICQLVEGNPLALVLAAGWLRVLTSAEIVQEIETCLDFLSTSQRNFPQRHRSLRAVFDSSWRMLSDQEKIVFAQFSIFRGGFTRKAAQAVTGASLSMLMGFTDKSLMRLNYNGRYEIHELLRQYATEKLWTEADELRTTMAQTDSTRGLAQIVLQRYCYYYLDFACRREAMLKGSTPRQAVAEIWAELDNIRHAWQWAVVEGQLADLSCSLEALAAFYEFAGLFQEGRQLFETAATQLKALENDETIPATENRQIRCCLLVKQARFGKLQGTLRQALTALEAARQLTAQTENSLCLAEAYWVEGLILEVQGKFAQSFDRFDEARARYQRLNDRRGIAQALKWMAFVCERQQMPDEALLYLEQAQQIDLELGNKEGQAHNKSLIAYAYYGKEMFATGLRYQQEALSLYEELDYALGIVRAINNIGEFHYRLENYAEALEYLQRARQAHRQFGNHADEIDTLEGIGRVYLALKAYDSARQCFDQTIHFCRQAGMKQIESRALVNLGVLLSEIGDHDQARAQLQQALTLAQEVDDPRLVAICLGELGTVYHRTGQFELALTNYEQTIARLQDLGGRYNTAQFIVQQATLLFQQGQLDQAQALAREGIAVAQAVARRSTEFRGQRLLARIAFARGDRELAARQLFILLDNTEDPAEQAALHYDLWQIEQGVKYARLALAGYQQLVAQTPYVGYQERLQELQQKG